MLGFLKKSNKNPMSSSKIILKHFLQCRKILGHTFKFIYRQQRALSSNDHTMKLETIDKCLAFIIRFSVVVWSVMIVIATVIVIRKVNATIRREIDLFRIR